MCMYCKVLQNSAWILPGTAVDSQGIHKGLEYSDA